LAKPLVWLNPALMAGAAVPVIGLLGRAATGDLGANPIATALNQLGLLALVMLISTLACTPLQLLFKWTWPVRIRRTLGLITFTYASLHLLTYVLLDQQLALRELWDDVVKRPFITVGFLAWVSMVPLAWTSTNASVKKHGYEKWKRLHRLVYATGCLAIIHFVWRVKKDATEPLIYGAILVTLFAIRILRQKRKSARS
jgi:sulfoxide reductase heme-binding subunit YedZ